MKKIFTLVLMLSILSLMNCLGNLNFNLKYNFNILIKESKERVKRLVYQYNNNVGSIQRPYGGLSASEFFRGDQCKSQEALIISLRESLNKCLNSAKSAGSTVRVSSPFVQQSFGYVDTQINS